MESYGLELDDLFDNNDISQDLDNFEALNEASDNLNGSQQQDGGDNDTSQNGEEGDISQQVAEKLRKLGTGAAKKRVMRPQPKLDPARLTGERGIPILEKTFKKIKYKGKGHELSDLNKMMSMMEHWSHRLYPKMPFDELIERVEKLGQKKAVQTVMNKIRLDMPLLDEDFVAPRDSDEEGDNPTIAADVPEGDNLQIPDMMEDHTLDEDEEVLNELLEQENRGGNSQSQQQRDVMSASTPYPKPANKPTAADTELTEEQLEKIRQNQEKAKRRRLNKSSGTDESSMETTQNFPADNTSSCIEVIPYDNNLSKEHTNSSVANHTPTDNDNTDIDIKMDTSCCEHDAELINQPHSSKVTNDMKTEQRETQLPKEADVCTIFVT